METKNWDACGVPLDPQKLKLDVGSTTWLLFPCRLQSRSRRLAIRHYLSHRNEDLLTWWSAALTRRNFPETSSACSPALLAPSLMIFTYSFHHALLRVPRSNTVQFLSMSQVQYNPIWAIWELSVSASWYFSICPRTLSTNGSILAGKLLEKIPRGLEDVCWPTSGEIGVRTPYQQKQLGTSRRLCWEMLSSW